MRGERHEGHCRPDVADVTDVTDVADVGTPATSATSATSGRLVPSLLCLLLLGAPACRANQGERPPAADVVATVNGESITKAQLQKALARAQRDNENLSPRTEADRQAFKAAVLEDLVSQAVVLQAARAASVTVPPERVERELLRLKAEYPGPAFDQALAEGAQTPEELREQTRLRLTIEQFFAKQVVERVAVTDPEVEAYYEAHKAEFAQPEAVHAEQIVVEDAETAKKVLAEVHKGERFEELARKYSRSPDAKVGGDLGFFPKGQMPEVFDQVCFTLKKGEVSEVISSPYGYHLFKLLEKRPAGQAPLAEVRPKVEARLRKEKEAAAQKAKLEELRQKAAVHLDEKVLASVP